MVHLSVGLNELGSMRSMSYIIAVDFDGTIVENKSPEIGELLPHCFHYLSEFKARGAKI